MRTSLSVLFCVSLLVAGHALAQEAKQPSRQESFERDGIIWGSAPAWGVPFQENLTADTKVAGLSRFWMEVKINFPHFAAVPDLDWDKTYVDFIPKVRATTSTYEYYRLLQRMCALLKDGHSDVFLPKELAERMEADLPLRIDLIENRVFVTGVDSEKLAADGVTAGLEILKIDGVPVHEYAAKNRRPYVASNSPQHVEVKVYSYGLLAGPRDRPVSVAFRSRDGRVVEKRLSRGAYPDRTTLPVLTYRKLAGNIAYIAINTFNSEDAQKEFEKHLPEIRGSDGLILDVRQNDGGSGVIAYNLIGYLTDKDFATPPWKSRQYVATLRAWGTAGGWYEAKPSQWKGRPDDFYSKPVVMLIGPRSLSATDVFAETFHRLQRGKLIGEPTAGSTGDPLAFALPGGGAARVATSADVGAGLVGRGVPPDILVPRTVPDLLAGRDAALEAGIAELRTRIGLASPRLDTLRAEMAAGGAPALERFWRRLADEGTPLVEGEGTERLVTYVWRGGDETRNVLVVASPSDLASEEDIAEAGLSRLPGTDVWYKSRRMKADARFGYAFSVNDSLVPSAKATEEQEEARWAALKPDPLNPRRAPGPLESLAELPAAPKQPWIEPRPNVPAGRIEEHRFRSERLGNERIVRVYTPPGYDPEGTPYGLLVVLDGRTYTSDVPAPTILDNLLAAGRIPPLVAVFVANPSAEARGLELTCHPPFAEFLGLELIPWVRRGYRVTADPARTAIAGSSLGGLAAACAAVRHPDVFGKVLSLSGSFYWGPPEETEPEELARRLATGPKLPLRFYLEAGLMEDRPRPGGTISLLTSNRHLRAVLQAKGYAVEYREFNGGHSILNWRGSFADGLLALFQRD